MVLTYDEARSWLMDGGTTKPHLLLGNGFSMAYDRDRFSYAALADQAEAEGLLPASAQQLMDVTGSRDFEAALRQLEATADTLEALDRVVHAATIAHLRDDIEQLREALAQAVAGLHPDRPYEIDSTAYERVRRFLDSHKSIYSVSYDLLTYWTLMQDVATSTSRRSDGFRDSGVTGDETVKWDIYEPYNQTVHYLHGALHLFLGPDGLRKLTYSRTGLPLVDQVREQLALRRYPLYVAEGESTSKMTRINASAYLARALRSLSSCQGTLLVYGHSLDPNDDHVFEAVVRSKVRRIAVSLYGDPNSTVNVEIRRRVADLATRRALNGGLALEYEFFNAGSVDLWHTP